MVRPVSRPAANTDQLSYCRSVDGVSTQATVLSSTANDSLCRGTLPSTPSGVDAVNGWSFPSVPTVPTTTWLSTRPS